MCATIGKFDTVIYKMATNVVLDTTMGSITVELYNDHAPKVNHLSPAFPEFY